jgi:hypothetical protein
MKHVSAESALAMPPCRIWKARAVAPSPLLLSRKSITTTRRRPRKPRTGRQLLSLSSSVSSSLFTSLPFPLIHCRLRFCATLLLVCFTPRSPIRPPVYSSSACQPLAIHTSRTPGPLPFSRSIPAPSSAVSSNLRRCNRLHVSCRLPPCRSPSLCQCSDCRALLDATPSPSPSPVSHGLNPPS